MDILIQHGNACPHVKCLVARFYFTLQRKGHHKCTTFSLQPKFCSNFWFFPELKIPGANNIPQLGHALWPQR